MEIGVFARTYHRDTLNGVLDAVVADGFSSVQFNMSCVGLESMPSEIDNQTIVEIRKSMQNHDLQMCALSAMPRAWSDLVETLLQCISIAEEFDLRLGIEPEINNVIDSPQKARMLLDEMQSPRLAIVMDPANIFRFQDLPQMDAMLIKSFELLAPYITLAHCKDVSDENPPIFGAAGTGVLNYALYIQLLREMDYQGPLILHSLSEQQVPASVEYVRSFL
jgi:sugar phosphate isomerase/epimerase